MLVIQPGVRTVTEPGMFRVEDSEGALTFHNDSAILCRRLFEIGDTWDDVESVARASGYAERAARECIDMLAADGFVFAADIPQGASADQACDLIKRAGRFWNGYVMSRPFPARLLQGHATQSEVLGWGLEFFHFVRAAREYMARGAARITGPTPMLAEFWDHFAEEAFHDSIFRDGLVGSGLAPETVANRLPLASTHALLNFLWEASETSLLDYAAVFAVMQPGVVRTPEQIEDNYNTLTGHYPFARALFDAFKAHDRIDADLEHSTLAIEPLIRSMGGLSRSETISALRTIRTCAENFEIFFAGIAAYYKAPWAVGYRQRPNASALAAGSALTH